MTCVAGSKIDSIKALLEANKTDILELWVEYMSCEDMMDVGDKEAVLKMAFERNHVKFARMVLDESFDAAAQPSCIIKYASVDIISKLMARGIKVGNDAYRVAIERGDPTVCDVLKSAGVDFAQVDAYAIAVSNVNHVMVKWLHAAGVRIPEYLYKDALNTNNYKIIDCLVVECNMVLKHDAFERLLKLNNHKIITHIAGRVDAASYKSDRLEACAFKHCSIKTVMWLVENKYVTLVDPVAHAVACNRMDVVKWLCAKGAIAYTAPPADA